MRIYFDADAHPYVDDLAPMPAPVVPVRRQRPGLRNWQKFLACYVLPCMAGGTMILWGWEESVYLNPATAVTGLLIWLATVGVILTIARMKGRL